MSEDDKEKKEAKIVIVAVAVILCAVCVYYFWDDISGFIDPGSSDPESSTDYTDASFEDYEKCTNATKVSVLNLSTFEDMGNTSIYLGTHWWYGSSNYHNYKYYIDNISIGTSIPVILEKDCYIENYASKGPENRTIINIKCGES